LKERQIGLALSVQAVAVVASQSLLFPVFHRVLGSVKLFKLFICCYPVAIVLLPWSNFAARNDNGHLSWALFGASLLLLSIGNCVYSANMLLINASAPSRSALGTLNGLAQTVSSSARAIAPATANSLFALSIEKQVAHGGLVWICLSLFALLSVCNPWLLLEDKPATWRLEEVKAAEEDDD